MTWIEILAFYAVGSLAALLVQGILIRETRLSATFGRILLRAVGWPVVLVILLWRLVKFLGSWALVLIGVPFVRFLFGPNPPKRPKEEQPKS